MIGNLIIHGLCHSPTTMKGNGGAGEKPSSCQHQIFGSRVKLFYFRHNILSLLLTWLLTATSHELLNILKPIQQKA